MRKSFGRPQLIALFVCLPAASAVVWGVAAEVHQVHVARGLSSSDEALQSAQRWEDFEVASALTDVIIRNDAVGVSMEVAMLSDAHRNNALTPERAALASDVRQKFFDDSRAVRDRAAVPLKSEQQLILSTIDALSGVADIGLGAAKGSMTPMGVAVGQGVGMVKDAAVESLKSRLERGWKSGNQREILAAYADMKELATRNLRNNLLDGREISRKDPKYRELVGASVKAFSGLDLNASLDVVMNSPLTADVRQNKGIERINTFYDLLYDRKTNTLRTNLTPEQMKKLQEMMQAELKKTEDKIVATQDAMGKDLAALLKDQEDERDREERKRNYEIARSNYSGVSSGIIAIMGEINPERARQMQVVSEAGLKSADLINQVLTSKNMTTMGSAAMTGNFIAIGLGLVKGLRQQGPSTEEKILIEVKFVQRQIDALKRHMDMRFDRLDVSLREKFDRVYALLDNLEEKIRGSSERIQFLARELAKLSLELNRSEGQILDHLHSLRNFFLLEKLTLSESLLERKKGFIPSRDRMRTALQSDIRDIVGLRHSTEKSNADPKNDSKSDGVFESRDAKHFAGSFEGENLNSLHRDLLTRVPDSNLNLNLNMLYPYVGEAFIGFLTEALESPVTTKAIQDACQYVVNTNSARCQLPDVERWAIGAQAYARVALTWPEYIADYVDAHYIEDLMLTGQQLRNFIQSLTRPSNVAGAHRRREYEKLFVWNDAQLNKLKEMAETQRDKFTQDNTTSIDMFQQVATQDLYAKDLPTLPAKHFENIRVAPCKDPVMEPTSWGHQQNDYEANSSQVWHGNHDGKGGDKPRRKFGSGLSRFNFSKILPIELQALLRLSPKMVHICYDNLAWKETHFVDVYYDCKKGSDCHRKGERLPEKPNHNATPFKEYIRVMEHHGYIAANLKIMVWHQGTWAPAFEVQVGNPPSEGQVAPVYLFEGDKMSPNGNIHHGLYEHYPVEFKDLSEGFLQHVALKAEPLKADVKKIVDDEVKLSLNSYRSRFVTELYSGDYLKQEQLVLGAWWFTEALIKIAMPETSQGDRLRAIYIKGRPSQALSKALTVDAYNVSTSHLGDHILAAGQAERAEFKDFILNEYFKLNEKGELVNSLPPEKNALIERSMAELQALNAKYQELRLDKVSVPDAVKELRKQIESLN